MMGEQKEIMQDKIGYENANGNKLYESSTARNKAARKRKSYVPRHERKRTKLIYITRTGHRSFYIKKRIKGQSKEIILGHFPAMTVKLARKAAQKIKG